MLPLPTTSDVSSFFKFTKRGINISMVVGVIKNFNDMVVLFACHNVTSLWT